RAPRVALLVAGPSALTDSDRTISRHLEALGYTVQAVPALKVTAPLAETAAVVVIAPSASAEHLKGKPRAATVPILVCSPATFATMNLTGPMVRGDYGTAEEAAVSIRSIGHPLA